MISDYTDMLALSCAHKRLEGGFMRRFAFLKAIFCLLLVFSFAADGYAASAKITAKDIAEMDAGQLLAKVGKDRGKLVIVNIFASWCPPCRDEIPGLVNVRKEFKEDEVVVIGVSVDKSMNDLVKYVNGMGINYPVFLAKGDFISRVGVTAVPQLLVYDKEGELVINHRGLVDEADLKKSIEEIQQGDT